MTLGDVLAQWLSVLKCLCREGLRYRSDFSFWSSTLHFRRAVTFSGDLVSIHCRGATGVQVQPKGCNLASASKETNHWAPTWQHTQRGIGSAFKKQVQKMSLIQPLSAQATGKLPTSETAKAEENLETPGMLMWCPHSCTLALDFELWSLEIQLAGQYVPRKGC